MHSCINCYVTWQHGNSIVPLLRLVWLRQHTAINKIDCGCQLPMLFSLQLSSLNNLTVYGPSPSRGRAALCSFNVKGLHATDISTLLDQEGTGSVTPN